MMIIVTDFGMSSFAICRIIFPSFLNYILLNIKIFFFLISSGFIVDKYFYDIIANNDSQINKCTTA